MTANLRSRLENYKFKSAQKYITTKDSDELRRLVNILAKLFGDCGWINADMGFIIDAAILGTLKEFDEEFDEN